MFKKITDDPNVTGFIINILSGLTQVFLVFLINQLRKHFVKKSSSYGLNGILYDRRYLLLIQVFLILLTLVSTLIIFFDVLSKLKCVLLISFTFILILALVLRELMMFWHVGLNHITSSIAKDTYSRAFNSTNSIFYLVGTNAFSFSNLKEFEEMLKRIKQNSGHAKILLADPNCRGLSEAARNRNCKDNLYQNQGKISLGQIVDLKRKLGVSLEIKLYDASCIEELPIFRSMFLDGYFCIASIAVYGREDHGKSFPQIFSKNNNHEEKTSKSMYNVVHRYFQRLWDSSQDISQENDYLEYWQNNKY